MKKTAKRWFLFLTTLLPLWAYAQEQSEEDKNEAAVKLDQDLDCEMQIEGLVFDLCEVLSHPYPWSEKEEQMPMPIFPLQLPYTEERPFEHLNFFGQQDELPNEIDDEFIIRELQKRGIYRLKTGPLEANFCHRPRTTGDK